jgi:hypothetical protein
MSDVYAVFGTLLAMGIVYPGMLTTAWLIFPKLVEGASRRIEHTPWKSLGMGVAAGIPIGLVVAIFLASPFGPVRFLGGSLLIITLGFASLGAAGLTTVMGARIRARSADGMSMAAGYLRGAVALELAAAFPIIGWFFVIPVVTVSSLGAALFAAVGWVPAEQPQAQTVDEAALSQA